MADSNKHLPKLYISLVLEMMGGDSENDSESVDRQIFRQTKR